MYTCYTYKFPKYNKYANKYNITGGGKTFFTFKFLFQAYLKHFKGSAKCEFYNM